MTNNRETDLGIIRTDIGRNWDRGNLRFDIRGYGGRSTVDQAADIRANDEAIAKIIEEMPDEGGTLVIPMSLRGFNYSQTIDPGSKTLTIQGHGWKCLVGDRFGNSNWANFDGSSYVHGSVLRQTSTTDDGIKISTSDNYRGLILRDVALIGPGSGTTIGVNAGTGDNNNELKTENVLVANFATGWSHRSSFDNEFRGLMIRSCTTGLKFSNTVTDTWFYGLNVQGCDVGIDVIGDGVNPMTGVHVYGGLIQGDTIGIRINAGASMWSFDGLWFECGVGTLPIVLNAATGSIGDISFINCRCSDTWTLSVAAGSIITGSTIAGVRFRDCYMAGTTVVLDASITDVQALDTVFAAFDPNGASRVTRRDRNTALSGESITSFNNGNIAAGSFAPDWRNGTMQHGIITGNLTIDVPVHAPADIAFFEIVLRQDGTGGYNLTAGANVMGPALSNTGNTMNNYTVLRYRRLANSSPAWIVEQIAYFS